MRKISKKTIAIFSGYTLPHLGGVEKYTDNLSKQLIALGYNVIIVGTDYDFSGKLINEEAKILYLRLPIYKLFSSRYPIIKKNKRFRTVIKKLSEYKIDSIIVNTRFYLTSLIGAKYGKQNNIPVYLIEHGSQHLTVDNKVLDFFGAIYEHCLTHFLKKYVTKYYGVSQGACDWQKHFGIKSKGVWYNSINDFSKGIKINKTKDNNINILYAGRILKQKGIIDLVESFIKLSKKYDNIYLTIAGDGNLLKFLKENYKTDRINFLGKVDFDELKKLYAITDIFVYAPIWPEGLPTSILEAGLMKCAVLGSPQGGIKEIIIDGKTGLIINDRDSLYKAIEKLIKDDKLRNQLSNNLYKKVSSEFLWEKTVLKILKDIDEKK